MNRVASGESSEVRTLNTLIDNGRHSAGVHRVVALSLEGAAAVGGTEGVEAVVHSTLESVAFPSEDVVTVMSIPGGVTLREDEGLAAVGGPHVAELSSVPSGLEENERHARGVRSRAVSVHQDDTRAGVDTSLEELHVAGMIRGVKVLSVPAVGEEDVGTNSTSALLLGELDGIVTADTWGRRVGSIGEAGTLPAAESKGECLGLRLVPLFPCAKHGVTSDHTEADRESGGLLSSRGIHVVNGHSTVGVTGDMVGLLGDSSEGAVGVLEVHDSRPVVGEVLRELAARAGRLLREVVALRHGDVERVSSDDLMNVARDTSRSDQGVSPLRHQLSTRETNERIGAGEHESDEGCQG